MTATLERNKRKVSFPAGKKRYVCVNRLAIVANVTQKKSYPTVIVVDDDKHHEFHECDVTGTLQFDANRKDLPAKVFVETEQEIVAFVDTQAEPTFLNLPKPPPFYVRWWESFLYALGYVPVLGCVLDMKGYDVALHAKHHRPEQHQPRPEPEPKAEPQLRPHRGCG